MAGQLKCRKLPEINKTMVFLPDSLLSAIFRCLDAPADFAHCACVSRRWRALSKSAHPYRLLIDWQAREEYLYGRLFWLCDKLARGQLTDVKCLTLDVNQDIYQSETDLLQLRSIMTIMKCLALHSCTVDTYLIEAEVYKFLPDSIRNVTDLTCNQFNAYLCQPMAEPCFGNISTFCVENLWLETDNPWFDKPPVHLQRLTVTGQFYADKAASLRLAEIFPALNFVDVTVKPIEETEGTLQRLLELPQLNRAHFRFFGDVIASRLVLDLPSTVTLTAHPLDGLKVGLVPSTSPI